MKATWVRLGTSALVLCLLAGCAGPGPGASSSAAPRAAQQRSSDPSSDSTASARSKHDAGSTGAPDQTTAGGTKAPKGADAVAPPAASPGSIGEASAFLTDAVGDTSGDEAPAYADIKRATITSDGSSLSLALDFADELPAHIQEKGTLIAGFGLQADDQNPQYAFILQGTKDGWDAIFQKNGEQSPFRGDFVTEGSTATFTAPWRMVGGVREFRWGASLRWFASDPSGAVLQAADRVPEGDPATFRPS